MVPNGKAKAKKMDFDDIPDDFNWHVNSYTVY